MNWCQWVRKKSWNEQDENRLAEEGGSQYSNIFVVCYVYLDTFRQVACCIVSATIFTTHVERKQIKTVVVRKKQKQFQNVSQVSIACLIITSSSSKKLKQMPQ